MSINHLKLSDIIQSHIHLGALKPNGWYPVRDPTCNDHSARGGFKFEGNAVGWFCFNCGSKAKYEEGSSTISKEFRKVLYAFGITNTQIDEVLGSAFFNIEATKSSNISLESLKPEVRLYTPEVPLPPKSYPIGAMHNEDIQVPLAEYLASRGFDAVKLNAHFSLDPKYLNRIILPCIRDGKVIFWQARALADQRPRYISPSINKDAVMWGYDNFNLRPSAPLFITEGIFDAAACDGVALIGSTINAAKIEILNRCRRRCVVVVDRDDNGSALAQLALSHGWEITFPPAGATDVNDSMIKYGKLFTIWALMKNATIPTGLKTSTGITVQSELQLKMELALARMRK